jgi:hypothetical protein
MATQTFMPELSLNERRELLHAQADKIEEGSYYKPLTEEELTARKDSLSTIVLDHSDMVEEKAELVKGLNERIKEKVTEKKKVLQAIRTRQEERNGIQYHLQNYETGMVEVYDEDGELIYSRRLRPDEKQTTIHQHLRAVTNG